MTAPVRRGGRLYVLHDTAGLREDAGRIEAMGITRARETAAGADLVLMLADAAAPEWPAMPSAPAMLRVLTKGDLSPGVANGDAMRHLEPDGHGRWMRCGMPSKSACPGGGWTTRSTWASC